jgi:predicted anti-sigma-YlaC factor YlaD
MDCDTAQSAISARLDGEDLGVDPVDLGDHLERCTACRAFARDAEAMHREVRLARAPSVPDLTSPILASIGSDNGYAPHERALRVTLAIVASVMIVAALPAFLLGDDAAWRPSRLPGLLPVVTALVACLLATSVLDVLDGSTAALTEVQHAVEVVGLAAAWLLAHPLQPRRRARLSTS